MAKTKQGLALRNDANGLASDSRKTLEKSRLLNYPIESCPTRGRGGGNTHGSVGIELSVRFLLGSHDAIHDRGHSLKPPISAGMGQFIRPLTHTKTVLKAPFLRFASTHRNDH